MPESLNVIALISGGKDSFFSILHCIQNGHKVVALGNLYPAPLTGENDDEYDLNSFMYQTVGHTMIPLYEQALQIPLYRQPIIGSAVQTAASYSPVHAHPDDGQLKSEKLEVSEDETESLVPLLKRIMKEHPAANAISTGAILSTYQRTRVESVALRLGLTPLGFLWKYPILPPATQASLLEDMQSIGLDSRIIKVASGGLDESFLWQNVASEPVMRRIEKSMKRFGTDGDGAVLGEGGEFETLVIDGPASLFKGRIEIEEEDRRIVREGGGAAWLRILKARVVMKDVEEGVEKTCRIPELLTHRFSDVLEFLRSDQRGTGSESPIESTKTLSPSDRQPIAHLLSPNSQENILRWTFTSESTRPELPIAEEVSSLISEIKQRLNTASLQPTDITSTTIILRSMSDFAAINKIYGSLFTAPNPPSRVTIASGSALITIHLTLHPSSPTRKALHVQSRSYWAPANIGPYSQAICTDTVSVAGQIPLVPHTMALPPSNDFELQAVLSLQHLWRIGEEMGVCWWTSTVAYLPRGAGSGRAVAAGRAWEVAHGKLEEDEEGEERDLWEEKNYAGMEVRGGESARMALPDWEAMKGESRAPPFWAAEVEELPRGAGIEWHAHLGVVRGPVELYPASYGAGWTIHQCSFGGRIHSVVMVDRSSESSDVSEGLGRALKALGIDSTSAVKEHAAYVDVSVEGLQDIGPFNGAIPCRSIWDISGKKLALVLLFDT